MLGIDLREVGRKGIGLSSGITGAAQVADDAHGEQHGSSTEAQAEDCENEHGRVFRLAAVGRALVVHTAATIDVDDGGAVLAVLGVQPRRVATQLHGAGDEDRQRDQPYPRWCRSSTPSPPHRASLRWHLSRPRPRSMRNCPGQSSAGSSSAPITGRTRSLTVAGAGARVTPGGRRPRRCRGSDVPRRRTRLRR